MNGRTTRDVRSALFRSDPPSPLSSTSVRVSPLRTDASIRELQRALAETRATVNTLQKREDASLRADRIGRASSRAASSPLVDPGRGLSQLWQVDALERQLRDAETQKRARRPASSADYRTQTQTGVDGQRALQIELRHVREEKEILEAEAGAFKRRMEAAVNSFEAVSQEAADERAALQAQLRTAQQQLAALQLQTGRGTEGNDATLPASVRAVEADERDGVARAGTRVARMLAIKFIIQSARISQAAAFSRWSGAARSIGLVAELQGAHSREVLSAQRANEQARAAADARLADVARERAELESALRRANQEASSHGVAAQELAANKSALAAARADAGMLGRRVTELEAELASSAASTSAAASASELAAGTLRTRIEELGLELAAAAASAQKAEAAPRAKVVALSRMVKDQQDELRDAYRFSAGCKMLVAVGERTALALSLALTRWRHACDLQDSGRRAQAAEAEAARTARAQVDERNRRIAELEAELRSAAAAGRAAVAAPRPKEKALARMLRDQQEELRDAYGFSARCKLRVTIEQRATLALSGSFSRWRHACELQEADLQLRRAGEHRAEALAAGSEASALRSRVAEVEGRLTAAVSSAKASSAQAGALGRRVAELEQELASASTTPRAKVEKMTRMLRDQQEELRDAYRFSARCKLLTTIERRVAVALSGTFSRWHQACVRQHGSGHATDAAQAAGADYYKRAKAAAAASTAEIGTLRQRVAELEQELASASTATPRAKVEKMTRMLRDQQEELRDAYRFSAGCKLLTVVERHAAMKLSGTFSHWRRECELADAAATRQLQLGNLEAECRRELTLGVMASVRVGRMRDC